jgi:hypothetical protein
MSRGIDTKKRAHLFHVFIVLFPWFSLTSLILGYFFLGSIQPQELMSRLGAFWNFPSKGEALASQHVQ